MNTIRLTLRLSEVLTLTLVFGCGQSQLVNVGGAAALLPSGEGASAPLSLGLDMDAAAAPPRAGSCVSAVSCALVGANCGPIPDGCGGVLQCGTCSPPSTCGGGGVPSACGGGGACVPRTCKDLGASCGVAGDGCGHEIDCGACAPPETCGGGGKPSVCGAVSTCVPQTCVNLGATCGSAGDGCGGIIDCGTCGFPETCGGGGTPSACGAQHCKPKACKPGIDCGPIADGCGGLVQCGGCTGSNTCGGGGAPSVCAPPSNTAAQCTNLCKAQVACAGGGTTSVSGVVYAPGHDGDPAPPRFGSPDPLFNVLVYIPNAAVAPFAPGVACDQCGSTVSGSPVVSAFTGTDGSFVLNNVPVGKDIPLVIQSGRWRRQVTIPKVTACQNTPLPAKLTRLPRTRAEGDIPHMAFATGAVDALECVLRKIGVDDSEFTAPDGPGRVHLYVGSGGPGATAGPTTPSEGQLWSSPTTLAQYDMVLFPCQGARFDQNPTAQANLINYASAGGRVFATHFSYVWLYNVAPFSGTANWHVDQTSPVNQPAVIDTSFPKGKALAQWLVNVGATSTFGQVPVNVIRNDVQTVVPPSEAWLSIQNPQVTVHYTFNTPVGESPDRQCGRVLFDDFHVEDASYLKTTGLTFPSECRGGLMTPQEKLLEFMLFDLGACVTPDVPTCTPTTCEAIGVHCGPAGDGCGGLLDCGTCPSGLTCGGGGVPNACGAPTCSPTTCASGGVECGPTGDGCGGLLQCGTCPSGQTCGGGGKPGKCGGATCTPRSCAAIGVSCGPAGDGCGGLLQCGQCPSGQTCGGGGVSGKCGAPSCTPLTCSGVSANCGQVADGCGGILNCGTCGGGETCGGGARPNLCSGGVH